MDTVGLLAFIVILLAIGVVCLWRPDKVQTFAIRSVSNGITSRIGVLNRFVRSRQYLLNLRICGIVALLLAAFLLWMFIKNY